MASFEELKSAYETKVTEFQDAVKSVTAETEIDEKGNVTIPERGYAAIKSMRADITELEGLLTDGEKKSAFTDWAQEGTETAARFAAPVAEYKSVSDILFESEEFKDMIENRRAGMIDDVKIEARDIVSMQTKDVYTQMGAYGSTSPRGYGIVHQELPFVAPKQRPTRVRDLFPNASTTANYLEYFKSTGFTGSNPNNAAFVPERVSSAGTYPPASNSGTNDSTDLFGLKPKSNIAFTSASDPVRTIAHWVAAHRNALSDKPQLRSVIDNQLLYGLQLVEDDALLNGTGSNESIQGLLNRTGIQSFTGVSTDYKADQVRKALTLLELAFYPANGIVMHPTDWQNLELQKAVFATSGGDGQYMLTTNVAVGAQKQVWQTQVVSTPAITAGTFLTGAFGQAAQVYDREQANIRVAEQHADFFVRNAVVILAEERLALTVPRPEGLVKGTFA